MYMPYKKYSRKKYTKKSSRFDTYSKCAAQAGKDGAALYQLVKPFLPFNVEYKNVNRTDSVSPSTTSQFQLLNGMARGTDSLNRIGRSIRMTTCQLNVDAQLHASATSTVIRWLLVYDKQPNDADPDANDLITTLAGIRTPDSFRRFNVIKDSLIHLNSDHPHVVRKHYFRLSKRNQMVEFDAGDTGTITDINTGALHVLYLSDQATNTPTVTLRSRVQFIDN